MIKCPNCSQQVNKVIYKVGAMPIFQNKVYQTRASARNVVTGRVVLSYCANCQLVFNSQFNSRIMDYDQSYHNEQNYSPFFKQYLTSIISFIKKKCTKKQKIVEIGCGKGYFLELLQRAGYNVSGFDPAYDGHNKVIKKKYFEMNDLDVPADLIIIRHTMEHLQDPFQFLKKIKE